MSENLIGSVNNIEIFNGKFNFLFKCDLKGVLGVRYINLLFK